MGKAEDRLSELGIELPNAPLPMANYVTCRHSGNLLYFSGQVPSWMAGRPYSAR